MKNTDYRNCFLSDSEPNCKFADFNKGGNHCCTVDGIVSIRYYGCRPQEAINKLDEKWGNKDD